MKPVGQDVDQEAADELVGLRTKFATKSFGDVVEK
jgi:hypothetical protein